MHYRYLVITHLFILYVVYSGAFLGKWFAGFPPRVLLGDSGVGSANPRAGPWGASPEQAVTRVLLSYCWFLNG